jgi:hypothetical protein
MTGRLVILSTYYFVNQRNGVTIQLKDTQHYGIQPNRLNCDIQHYDTEQKLSIIKLSVKFSF